MGKIFRRHPQLLKNRMNFGSKVQFLLKIGLEKEDLGRTIYNAPQLLGLREEKLRPTVKFLENIGVTGSSLRKFRSKIAAKYNFPSKPWNQSVGYWQTCDSLSTTAYIKC
uniref:Uncharacterized protein n=1 Tax=Picea sitchensis TaxID=3332 RepID=D5ADC3_PICSI|nr:unknown [Picea sitchensis]